MKGREAECRLSIEALGERAGALTGFTGRVIAALAHLREAWAIADDSNRPGIERAISAVLGTRSLSEAHSNSRDLARDVLAQGLDEGSARQLWESL